MIKRAMKSSLTQYRSLNKHHLTRISKRSSFSCSHYEMSDFYYLEACLFSEPTKPFRVKMSYNRSANGNAKHVVSRVSFYIQGFLFHSLCFYNQLCLQCQLMIWSSVRLLKGACLCVVLKTVLDKY